MRKIYLLVMFCTLLFSCEKTAIEDFENITTADDIVAIKLSANSKYLFADGISELEFFVNAYSSSEVTKKETKIVNGQTVIIDSVVIDTFLVKTRRLPDGFKIFSESGDEISDFKFTTETTEPSLTFFAEAGDITSSNITVQIDQTPAPLDEIVVPVVVHIVATDDTRALCDKIDVESIKEKIESLNDIFSKTKVPNAPHSVDLKIRFELVTEDVNGDLLVEEGINRIDLGALDTFGAYDYLKANLLWDSNKFLNIWICDWAPWSRWYDMVEPPMHITASPSIIPGIDLTQVASANDIPPTDDETATGILVTPGAFDKETLLKYIAIHYGLLETRFLPWDPGMLVDNDVDYCPDTYSYDTRISGYIWKWDVIEGITYKSQNIMDRTTTSSVITYDQGTRVRNVIQYCPLRQHIK